jgi:hypothetical protein
MEPTSGSGAILMLNRSTLSERAIAEARLGKFQLEGSRGQAMTRQIYSGGELTRCSLYSFASILSALSDVSL